MFNKLIKNNIYFIITLFVCLFVIIYFGINKTSFDGDELYSYTLSNSSKSGFISANISSNEWINGDDLLNSFLAKNRFNYFSVYRNQVNDVHPPFYYAIFHTISSLFNQNFSKWIGLFINIICFIISFVYLYRISNYFFDNKYISLFTLFLFGISLGNISTILFIRMYTLFTTFCIMLCYYLIKVIDSNSNNKKYYFMLYLCTFLGFMTHYYFLVFAFIISAIYCLYLIINKKFKLFIKYGIYVCSGVLSGVILFPFCYNHIFKGYRGVESSSNLINSSFVSNFKEIFDLLNKELFFNIGYFLIPLMLILGIIYCFFFIKKKLYKDNKNKIFMLIFGTVLLYFLVVIKMLEIKSTRYIYNIYPLCILIIVFLINYFISNKKKVLYIVLSLLSIFNLVNIFSNNPSWFKSENNYKKMNDMKLEYSNPIIYFYSSDYDLIYNSLFMFDYDKIFVYDGSDDDILITTINDLDYDNIILYFSNDSLKSKYLDLIKNNFINYKYTENKYYYLIEKEN